MKNSVSAEANGGHRSDGVNLLQERQFLMAQLIEVRHLHATAAGHPLMSVALAEREKELTEKLALLQANAE